MLRNITRNIFSINFENEKIAENDPQKKVKGIFKQCDDDIEDSLVDGKPSVDRKLNRDVKEK